jgi:MraZ protein
MSHLIGNDSCKVDVNGRFKMPKKFLEQLDLSSNRSFAIRKKLDDQCLEMFSYNDFQDEMNWILEHIDRNGNDQEEALFDALTDVDVIKLDEGDRLPLPKRLSGELKIENDIVVRGAGNRFEIRVKEDYEQKREQIKKNEKSLKELRAELSKKIIANQ